MQQGILSEGGETLLTLSPERGDLLLASNLGTLFHRGSGIPISTLFSKMLSANRFLPAPKVGLVFRGMSVGEYAYCPGPEPGSSCVEGVLPPMGTLELLPYGLDERKTSP